MLVFIGVQILLVRALEAVNVIKLLTPYAEHAGLTLHFPDCQIGTNILMTEVPLIRICDTINTTRFRDVKTYERPTSYVLISYVAENFDKIYRSLSTSYAQQFSLVIIVTENLLEQLPAAELFKKSQPPLDNVLRARAFQIVADAQLEIRSLHISKFDFTSRSLQFAPTNAKNIAHISDLIHLSKEAHTTANVYAFFKSDVTENLRKFSSWTAREILKRREYFASNAKIMLEIAAYSNLTLSLISNSERKNHTSDEVHYGHIQADCITCALHSNSFAALEKVSDQSITFFISASPDFFMSYLLAPFHPLIWLLILTSIVAMTTIFHLIDFQNALTEIYRPFFLQPYTHNFASWSWLAMLWIFSSVALVQLFLANFSSFTIAPSTAEIAQNLTELVRAGYKFVEDETDGVIQRIILKLMRPEEKDKLRFISGHLINGPVRKDSEKSIDMILSLRREDYKIIFPMSRNQHFHVLKDQVWIAPTVWAFKPLNLERNLRAFKSMMSSGIWQFLNSLTADFLILHSPHCEAPRREFKDLWLKDFQNYRFMSEIPSLRYSIHQSAAVLYAAGILISLMFFLGEIMYQHYCSHRRH